MALFGNTFGKKPTGIHLKSKLSELVKIQFSTMMLVENTPALVDFAQKAFMEGEIEFLKYVETYRTLSDSNERGQLGRKIFNDYIAHGAKRQANVSGQEIKDIQAGLSGASSKLFDKAYQQVRSTVVGQILDSNSNKHWVAALKKVKLCPVCKACGY